MNTFLCQLATKEIISYENKRKGGSINIKIERKHGLVIIYYLEWF